jgi:sec-independent protein translocase protein TatB
MFGIAPSELVLVALIALVMIGPKDFPKAVRIFGQGLRYGRAMKQQMLATVGAMMREVELRDVTPLPDTPGNPAEKPSLEAVAPAP